MSLLFSDISKASSDNHFAYLHFFFLGMVLVTACLTEFKFSSPHNCVRMFLKINPLPHTYTPPFIYTYDGWWFAHKVVYDSCNPMDCSLPGSSVHGISQAEYWSGLPFPSPGDRPNPGMEPMSPAFAGGFFTNWATREVYIHMFVYIYVYVYMIDRYTVASVSL